MILLLKMLLAHFIGDFLLQPASWVAAKETNKLRSPLLYCHLLVHGLLTLLFLGELALWPLALLVMLVHGCIDVAKIYSQVESTRVRWFFLDQTLHLISLIAIWLLWFHPLPAGLLSQYSGPLWIWLFALLLLTVVTGIFIQVAMWPWTRTLPGSVNDSLPNAGRYIGYLERVFILIFILTGHWESIGFLITAKSVFRFGDLKEAKNRKLTEYILIGTLLSFGAAILISLGTRWLLTLI